MTTTTNITTGNINALTSAIKSVLGTAGEQKTALMEAYRAAALFVIQGDNRKAMQDLVADVATRCHEPLLTQEQRKKAEVVRSALVAGLEALGGAGFQSKRKGHTFKTLAGTELTYWQEKQTAMMAAFELGLQAYGVKVEKTEAEKEEAKNKKTLRAEEKLSEVIKARGLVPEETLRMTDTDVLNAALTIVEAGTASLDMLKSLAEACKAKLAQAEAQASAKSKAQASARAARAAAAAAAAAEKTRLASLPAYERTAIESATK